MYKNRIIKILFIGQPPNTPSTGGIGSYINQRAHILTCNGFDVWWSNSNFYNHFNRETGKWEENRPVAPSSLINRLLKRFWYRFSPEWINASNNIKPDIIEIPDGLSSLLPKRRNIKVVIQCHVSWTVRNFLNREKLSFYREKLQNVKIQKQNKVFEQADYILACSHEVANLESGFHHIHPDRITILHHCFTKKAEPGNLSRTHKHENYFLVIGNFEYLKGFDLIINAFKLYRENGGKCIIKFVGNEGWKDSCFERDWGKSKDLQEFRKSPASNYVDFYGTIDKAKLSELRSKATAVIIASRFEAFTMVAGECFLSGIPVFISERTGWSRIIERFNPDMLIDPYNPLSIINVMSKIEDDTLREQYIIRNEKIREYLSGTELYNNTVKFYSNIIRK